MEVAPLARVNVFLGANNAGKTALLEAIELAVRGGEPWAVIDVLERRGLLPGRRELRGYLPMGLFWGRSPGLGDSFEVAANGAPWYRAELVAHDDVEPTEQEQLEGESDRPAPPQAVAEPPFGLSIEMNGARFKARSLASLLFMRRRYDTPGPVVRSLGTTVLDFDAMLELWKQLVLTPGEQRVVRTLQIIEPSVTRLAFLPDAATSRGGVFVQLEGFDGRVHLGSMGEGMQRLLALSLAIGSLGPGASLLIDEIDTGLHHTVMASMWKIVIEAAREFGFQVFATTHSLDCLRSLARVLEERPELAVEVAVHRIERGRDRSVHYTGEELTLAVSAELEMR